MRLYHISQQSNNQYDTYDSAVVAAENAKVARAMYPGSKDGVASSLSWHDWAPESDVEVVPIGTARAGQKRAVLCASFNAG